MVRKLGVEAEEERRGEGAVESESRVERNRTEMVDQRKERKLANQAPDKLGNLMDLAEAGVAAADEAGEEALVAKVRRSTQVVSDPPGVLPQV